MDDTTSAVDMETVSKRDAAKARKEENPWQNAIPWTKSWKTY